MAKTSPIPTRFDESTLAAIKALQARTGLEVSEVIRRAVNHTLAHIAKSGDVSVLFEAAAPSAVPPKGIVAVTLMDGQAEDGARGKAKRKREA